MFNNLLNIDNWQLKKVAKEEKKLAFKKTNRKLLINKIKN